MYEEVKFKDVDKKVLEKVTTIFNKIKEIRG